jgi:hypothetical protein
VKEEKIFDMLEHAEEGTMNELTDKCPDIGDEQFERMLAKSERKYKMMKRDILVTERDNIYMDENTVSGVKRIKRPVWITPLATAASVVLILGTVLGSIALFGRNGRTVNKGGGDTVPAVTATTTDKKGTETTVNSSATTSVKTTETQTVTTVSTSVQEIIAETNVQVVGSSVSANGYTYNDVFYDETYSDIARRLSTQKYHIANVMMMGDMVIQPGDDSYVYFGTDKPYLGIDRELQKQDPNIGADGINKVYFAKVTDSGFSSTAEIKNYIKAAYSDRYFRTVYENSFATGIDDLALGDRLCENVYDYTYIDYKGQLYKNVYLPYDRNGYLNPVEGGVIIGHMTEDSFTAYLLYSYKNGAPTRCEVLDIDIDPTCNDWRIEFENYLSYEDYLELEKQVVN